MSRNVLPRKYLLTLSELVDRLTITSLKEVFITEHKKEYAEEIKLILHDIDAIIQETKPELSAKLIRAIIILAQFNAHIWYGERAARNGDKENVDLFLTHSLNGIRCLYRNVIQDCVGGGRKDFKIDCLAAQYLEKWMPSE